MPIFVFASTAFAGNDRMEAYGWRLQNWLEAKFFRAEAEMGGSGRKTVHSADLLVDLIRLAALVPEVPRKNAAGPWRTFNGRYLLHVYDAQPKKYVALRKNATKTSPAKFARTWLERLIAPGRQKLVVKDLAKEGDVFRSRVGDINDLKLRLSVTNRQVHPLVSDEVAGSARSIYWCNLTRLDSIELKLRAASVSVNEDRTICEGRKGDFERIRSEIATGIGVPEDSLDKSPPVEADVPKTLAETQGDQVP